MGKKLCSTAIGDDGSFLYPISKWTIYRSNSYSITHVDDGFHAFATDNVLVVIGREVEKDQAGNDDDQERAVASTARRFSPPLNTHA